MVLLEDAIAAFKNIPAIKGIYTATDDLFVTQLLELTKGKTPDGVGFYRIWITAYRYLQQSPAIWRVKKHDRTELGNPEEALLMLRQMQQAEDLANELEIPLGQEAFGAEGQTVSIRVGSEFF